MQKRVPSSDLSSIHLSRSSQKWNSKSFLHAILLLVPSHLQFDIYAHAHKVLLCISCSHMYTVQFTSSFTLNDLCAVYLFSIANQILVNNKPCLSRVLSRFASQTLESRNTIYKFAILHFLPSITALLNWTPLSPQNYSIHVCWFLSVLKTNLLTCPCQVKRTSPYTCTDVCKQRAPVYLRVLMSVSKENQTN